MMRRILAPSVLGILVMVVVLPVCPAWAAQSAPAEAQPLERYLPASTSFVIAIRDMPGLKERWKVSGLGRLLADPVVKSYVGVFLEEGQIKGMGEKIKARTGRSVEELLSFFPGQVLIGITDFASLAELGKEGRKKGPIVLLADVRGHGKDVTEVLERLGEDEPGEGSTDTGTVTRVEKVEGVPVHFEFHKAKGGEEAPNGGWAVVGDTLVVALDHDILEDLVRELVNGPRADNLTGASGYQEAVSSMGRNEDGWVYAKLSDMVKAIQAEIVKEQEEKAKQGTEEKAEPASPFPFKAEQVIPAIGADALQNLVLGFQVTPRGLEATYSLHYSEESPLTRLLAYGPQPASLPTFIPQDAVGFSVARFDLQRAWQAIAEGVNNAFPGVLDMAKGQVAMLASRAQMQLDLKTELLENFGDEMIAVSYAGEANPKAGGLGLTAMGQQSAIMIGIKDQQQMQTFLEKVEKLAMALGKTPSGAAGGKLFSKETFGNMTIYKFQTGARAEGAPRPQVQPVLGVLPGYFCFSITGEDTLRRLEAGIRAHGRPLWKEPDVQAALKGVPPTANSIQFTRAGATLRPLLLVFKTAVSSVEKRLKEAKEKKETTSPPEPGAGDLTDGLPSEELIESYVSAFVSYVVKDAHVFMGKTVILNAEKPAR